MSSIFYAHIEEIIHRGMVPSSYRLSTGHFCPIIQNKRDVNFMQQLSDTMTQVAWKTLKNDYDEMVRIAIILRVPFRFEFGISRRSDGLYHSALRFG